jgi:hypothetical protein
MVEGLIAQGFAQTSRGAHIVGRVRPEHFGPKAWYHARMHPAERLTLTREEFAEFKRLGGPTADPSWDGRPPVRYGTVPIVAVPKAPVLGLAEPIRQLERELAAQGCRLVYLTVAPAGSPAPLPAPPPPPYIPIGWQIPMWDETYEDEPKEPFNCGR